MVVDRLPQVGDRIRFRKGVTDADDPAIKMAGFTGAIVEVYAVTRYPTMYGIDFDDETIAKIKRRYGSRWGDVESYTTWADDFDVIEEVENGLE